MKKDFDFDDMGRKTSYRVPEGFFDGVQREVQKRTYVDRPASRRLWVATSTNIAVAAVLVDFLLISFHFRQNDPGGTDLQRPNIENYTVAISADKWIHEMPDEELEGLVGFSENDMFLDQQYCPRKKGL